MDSCVAKLIEQWLKTFKLISEFGTKGNDGHFCQYILFVHNNHVNFIALIQWLMVLVFVIWF